MATTSSLPWCRRPKTKVSMSSCRWRCWRRRCRPHLQLSRHGEDDSTLLIHRRQRGGDKTPVPSNLTWRETNSNDSIYWKKKLIKNNKSPLPSASGEMPEEKGGGPAVVDGGGGSARAGVALPWSGYPSSRRVAASHSWKLKIFWRFCYFFYWLLGTDKRFFFVGSRKSDRNFLVS
jgi:hypothetical protein